MRGFRLRSSLYGDPLVISVAAPRSVGLRPAAKHPAAREEKLLVPSNARGSLVAKAQDQKGDLWGPMYCWA